MPIWLISDGVGGNDRQVQALAEAMQLSSRSVRVRPARPWRWFAPRVIAAARFAFPRLLRHDLRHIRYQAISRFPAVERDFSFVFDDSVTFERVRNAVAAIRIAELRGLAPAEIFRGGAIAAGKHSLLLRATFQSAERTLRDDEVTLWSQQIVKALQSLGGTLRAS